MSEVEKMYKLAGVEKEYYSFKSADGNTYNWELNENGNDKYNMCFIGKPEIKQRLFTAEKQLELIKWLSKLKDFEFESVFARDLYIVGCRECMSNNKHWAENKDFEQALAELLNDIWQDLTEQGKTEITEILRG